MNNILYINNNIKKLKDFIQIFSFGQSSSDYNSFNGLPYINPDHRYFDILTRDKGDKAVDLVKESYQNKTPIKVVFLEFPLKNGMTTIDTALSMREIDKNIKIVIVSDEQEQLLNEFKREYGYSTNLLFFNKEFIPLEVKQMALCLSEKYDAERIKETFLNNVTQELRSPLVSLIGFSNLLLENKNMDDQSQLFLKFILKNSNLLKTQIEDLISTFQSQENEIELFKNKFPVYEFLKRLESITQSIITESNKNVFINIEWPENDFEIHADETRIFQCLINLITNGLKFTNKGEITLVINKDKTDIHLKVKDSGIGIEGQYHKIIFEKYKKIESSQHKYSGLGLGLYVCKNIVDKHGGTIEIESNVGLGSEFTITLPQSA